MSHDDDIVIGWIVPREKMNDAIMLGGRIYMLGKI
jgi:hypothetical protein